ncbi:hypothetical protein CCICO_06900 [Corynebacterium ciconiae DSM 44920]|nr:hypothetical protein CCICO_06900 [Corynebacterium ciconiae DSM 44920]
MISPSSSSTPSPAPASTPARPLSAIRAAIHGGASTVGSIAAATGLDASVVHAGLEQLERMNLLTRQLQVCACSTSRSCASCSEQGSCEDPAQIGKRSGVVTLTLHPLPPRG